MPPTSAALFTPGERVFVLAALRAGLSNPFTPEHVAAQRDALDTLFVEPGSVLSPSGAAPLADANNLRIAAKLSSVLREARGRAGAAVSEDDLDLYHAACLLLLCDAYRARGAAVALSGAVTDSTGAQFRALVEEHRALLPLSGAPPSFLDPAHVFACASQIRRAYDAIALGLIGTSRLMAALRAMVWNAIFTRDLGEYLRTCDRWSADASTLVTGPSGTGKEQVAQAIGAARFWAFDAGRTRFTIGEGDALCAVNLSAVSASLFESELFGHVKGSFTGAGSDRKGVFEAVRPGGVVFLDEIAEAAHDKQVTLLRVLQERRFRRVGDAAEKPIAVRIVSATHRDMSERIAAGAFRLDLYQRLASVRIHTPSLRDQLDDAPDDLPLLVRVLARRAGSPATADRIAEDTVRYIRARLSGYAWPGNVRELGNCVESIRYGSDFEPLHLPAGADEDPTKSLRDGKLNLKDANRRYHTLLVHKLGSIAKAAEALGVHRHTVERNLDHVRLEMWQRSRRR